MLAGVLLCEDDEHTHQDANDGREGGEFTVIHQNCLGEDLAEDHIEHSTAGKAQQQTDGTAGILLQQSTDETAKTGSHNTSSFPGWDTDM